MGSIAGLTSYNRPVLISSNIGTSRANRNLRASAYNSGRPGASGDVLEAFYYGRAFAEVLGERVSAATTEVLSELGKMDAERRQASREFLEAVEARARTEITTQPPRSSAASSAASAQSMTFNGPAGQPPVELVRIPPRDLQEVVDDLRAEIATARSVLQVLKTSVVA